jgi:REP element-mobilizing transposase RayT
MNGHKIVNQNELHFLTLTTVGWVDLFTRVQYKDILLDSLRYCQSNKGLVINAYVIMSNHIHLIGYTQDRYKLSDVIRDFKRHTAKRIIDDLIHSPKESRKEWILRLLKYFAKFNNKNKTYQLWKQDNRPIELDSPKWILQKLDYTHLNPVRAGIVRLPEHYLYSSAIDYAGEKGLLDIELIDLGSTYGYVAT